MRHRFPVHTLLISIFFLLHVVNKYYALLPGGLIAEFLCYYLLLSIVLLTLGRLWLNDWLRAGVWATVLLIAFYFFGATHDALKKVTGYSFLSSYTLVLPLLLIGCLAFSWYIKKKKQVPSKASFYLTVLFYCLCAVELVSLGEKKISKAENRIAVPFPVTAPINAGVRPDIFFIVFDEFASTKSLQTYLGYDNSMLDTLLQKNNFYVIRNSKSNYSFTPYSIGATLNLHYFNKELSHDTLTLKTWLQGWHGLRHSKLPGLLASLGYQVHNYGLCNFEEYPAQTTPFFYPNQRSILYEETLWGRMEKDIWWNIYKIPLSFLTDHFNSNIIQDARGSVERNRVNYQSFLKELKTEGPEPKFVFAHVMLPHLPFVLNHQGQLLPPFLLRSRETYNKSRYLEQVQYANIWIDSIAQASNQSWQRPRIVIVQGDHGYRDPAFKNTPEHFMNLSTCYFSDHNYSMLYDSISPVNTFRVVFNKYFHSQLPLLKDSIVYIP